MAKKIDGIADPEAIRAYQNGSGYVSMLSDKTTLDWEDPNESAGYQNATMVVHEGAHEPVFTQSEVRRIIRGMMDLLDGDPEQVLAAIEAVNAKHGLGLSDPA